ncbi:heme-binding protein [Lysobacter sp. S4-A87]|uniref:GlcG/HbpS family heme-binding protein n=1 Tax=Lysobacter sp. S4-A87 TaxID=2925843 RepID=UPI001F53144A|nr:heme-binding protein [Lysobacter sp. S4-A87]UNK49859.1 heme-binding protein [Lysobacter sp. S4-A87]
MDILTTAKLLAERVEAEAAKVRIPVSVCVVDIHGNLVLQHRMNDAPAFSMEISERKAYTSALVGVRTADLLPLVQPGQSLFALLTMAGGRYTAMGGGAPLKHEGRLFAGVGVSGGTVEQDIAIVDAALS